MPGVRYGPDIADDAAAIYTGLVDLGAREKSIKAKSKAAKKAGKVAPAGLNKKDKAKYDRLAKLATDIFGVSRADMKKGNYGDLYKMQRYSAGGKTKKGAPSKGAKYAKDKRTGKLRKRSETTEFDKRSKGKTTRSEDRSGKTNQTYLGLTKPKAYREIEERAYKRMNSPKRGGSGVRVGKKRVKVPDSAALDRVGIARSRGVGTVTATRNKTTRNLRPPIVKKAKRPKAAASAKRAKGAQGKRTKAVRGAGNTKPGTRKK